MHLTANISGQETLLNQCGETIFHTDSSVILFYGVFFPS